MKYLRRFVSSSQTPGSSEVIKNEAMISATSAPKHIDITQKMSLFSLFIN